jgi:predicted HTH transcriptional regulator
MNATVEQPTLFGFATEQWVKAQAPRHEPARAPAERALHIHSLEAQDARAGELKGRKAAILDWLRERGPATDRQVRDALFGEHADMNMVRPRISELVAQGKCHEVGSVEDDVTGLHVRIVRAKNEGEA